jgi:hypothetical protein
MRVLKHERGLELFFGLNRNTTGSRLGQPSDHAQQRGLAASRWSQDGDELARGNFEIHAFDYDQLVEGLAYALQLQSDAAGGLQGAPLFDYRLRGGLILVSVGNTHSNGSFARATIHLEAIIEFLGIGQARRRLHYFPFAAVH